jgi:Zn-dependent M28 family amino/carboxypeptidase
MMGKRVYKTYVNLTNIVIRISDGTPAGKEHAILVNSHLDSTLPSPGAADDGLSVGVMLDCMRVLINMPDWSPKHSIVLCKAPFFSAYFRHFTKFVSVQSRRRITAGWLASFLNAAPGRIDVSLSQVDYPEAHT